MWRLIGLYFLWFLVVKIVELVKLISRFIFSSLVNVDYDEFSFKERFLKMKGKEFFFWIDFFFEVYI